MDLSPEQIRGSVDAALARPEWKQSQRMSRFLRFIVERTLAGDGDSLKETVIGMEVFDRPAGYDPKIDPIVRVEARRLRLKLAEYYSGPGACDSIRILIPKGSYRPQFVEQAVERVAPLEIPPLRPRLIARLVLVSAAVSILAPGLWLVFRGTPRSSTASSTPRLITGYQGYNRSPAFSPDGKTIAFSRNLDVERANIYVQPVSGGEVRQLTNQSSFDHEPVWSPDGQSIAFLREIDRNRYAIVLTGIAADSPQRLVAEVAVRGPIDFAADGKSLIAADRDAPSSPTAIFRIPLADGRKRQLTSPPKGTPGDSTPRVSPDGRSLAFVRAAESSVQDVYIADLEGAGVRRISQENRAVEGLAWHPSGTSIIASLQRGGELRSLWRVFLDSRAPERVPEAGIGPISPALSRYGELAYVTRLSDTNIWAARVSSGALTDAHPITRSLELDTSPQLSPEGTRIAWRSTSSGTNEVWIARADGSEPRQLTQMKGPTTGSAHWSPDGQWIVFDSRPQNNGDIFRIPAAGGTPVPLTRDPSNEVLPSYSHDGGFIYFSTDRSGAWEIWRMTADGKSPTRIVGHDAFNAIEAPDARWLYYTRQAGAEAGIWRIPIAGGPEEKLTAELTANFWGQWAVTAKSLFFAVFPPAGARRAISRVDLATGKVTDVYSLTRMPVQFDSGMSAAVDDTVLYWSQLDQAGSDVFLVTGFR